MIGKILSIVAATLAGLYIGFPGPPLPDEVETIRRQGAFFWYRPNEQSEPLGIFYRDVLGHGPEDKILLLVHGLPVSSYDWNKVLPGLRRNFGRVIVPDNLGAGLSDKPAFHNYTIFEYADILEALLTNLSVRRVHILCHDLGVTISQEMLVRFNKQHNNKDEDGLVIASIGMGNAAMFPRLYQPLLSQKILIVPVVGDLLVRLSNYFYFTHNLRSLFGNKTPEGTYVTAAWALLRHKDGHLALPRIMRYQQERFEHEHRWVGAIAETNIPVHYIYGPGDRINPPRTFEEYKVRVQKSSYFHMPSEIGHFPMWEAPERFLEDYENFLHHRVDH